jgi:cardiolipin synthase
VSIWSIPPGRAPYAEVTVGPNRLALLKDGYQAFPAMRAAIAQARRSICLESYIVKDDATGQQFLDALAERARAGVEVLVMYDHWGSELDPRTLARLAESGVKVHAYQPVRWTHRLARLIRRMLRRNHRKALVVDGEVGFLGGLNLSDDYAAVEDGGEGWRDTHLRLVGPAAADLERLFLETWRGAKGQTFREEPFRRGPPAACGALRIIGNHVPKDRKDIRRAYMAAFKRARHSILLTHAYFLPPSRLLKALLAAARRGVRVAIIIAATTDVKAVLFAARGLYPRLLRAGVEVYEWDTGRVLHAKTAVCDGEWSTVGSANLDALSLRQNLEVNATVEDADFGQAVQRLFLEDLRACVRVTQETVQSWDAFSRVLGWFAYRVRRWL